MLDVLEIEDEVGMEDIDRVLPSGSAESLGNTGSPLKTKFPVKSIFLTKSAKQSGKYSNSVHRLKIKKLNLSVLIMKFLPY